MRSKNGFTLIELLAVIAILGVVLTIATVSVLSIMNDSKEKSNKIDSDIVLSASETYITENYKTILNNLKKD